MILPHSKEGEPEEGIQALEASLPSLVLKRETEEGRQGKSEGDREMEAGKGGREG